MHVHGAPPPLGTPAGPAGWIHEGTGFIVPDGDAFLLVASQGGAPKNPVWYYNLVAHPDITIEHDGTRHALTARIVQGEEKASLWPVCDQHYADYAIYRQRTTRDIPLFRCEPRVSSK